MANFWQAWMSRLVITLLVIAGILLRHTALWSAIEEPQTPGFSVELLGWCLLTGSIFILTLAGLGAIVDRKIFRILTIGFVVLSLIYGVIFGFYEVTGKGLEGERLLAGLTAIYSGIAILLLYWLGAWFGMEPSMRGRISLFRLVLFHLIVLGLFWIGVECIFLHWADK